jgi:hypothetical protein
VNDDPYKEFEDARAEMKRLHSNPDELPVAEWMFEWRKARARIASAAYEIQRRAESLA